MAIETSAKIKSIKLCGVENVYNMEVDEHHNFSICNGLIVHNSMDELRYYIMSKPDAYVEPIKPLTGDALRIHEHIEGMTKKRRIKRHYV